MAAEPPSLQNLQVTTFHSLPFSAGSPAHPSQAVARSANLWQQQSTEIATSYSAMSRLLWSVLTLLLYGTPWFSTVPWRWYSSAARAEGATYHEASIQSSHAERVATGLQPVTTLVQKWHFQGHSSVKAREVPPPARKKIHINTQNYVLCGCGSWYYQLPLFLSLAMRTKVKDNSSVSYQSRFVQICPSSADTFSSK